MGKAREINKINFALTLLLSLIAVFKDLQSQSENEFVSKNSHEFSDLKELAKRFALTFGFDAIKNREPIIALHRAGILFAVGEVPEDPVAAPKRLLFLEVLNEFNHKLLKQDKKVILNFLDRRISPALPSSKQEEYQPLFLYRNSLVHGETAPEAPVSSKRAYARKRRGDHGELGINHTLLEVLKWVRLFLDEDDDEEDYEDEHNDPDFRG